MSFGLNHSSACIILWSYLLHVVSDSAILFKECCRTLNVKTLTNQHTIHSTGEFMTQECELILIKSIDR